ncbi:MAG: hypothetical protein ABIO76_03170, partial [Ginsengibacter sp.]
NVTNQLKIWKDNNNDFLVTLANSPILREAALLSANLSQLAASGLAALSFLQDQKKAGKDWLEQQLDIVEKAKQQGGRCELQVVEPIERLIRAAAGGE